MNEWHSWSFQGRDYTAEVLTHHELPPLARFVRTLTEGRPGRVFALYGVPRGDDESDGYALVTLYDGAVES